MGKGMCILSEGWLTVMVTVGFPTDMTAPLSKNFEATNGVMPKELVPQERMGNEEELAGSIIYLASKVRADSFCLA